MRNRFPNPTISGSTLIQRHCPTRNDIDFLEGTCFSLPDSLSLGGRNLLRKLNFVLILMTALICGYCRGGAQAVTSTLAPPISIGITNMAVDPGLGVLYVVGLTDNTSTGYGLEVIDESTFAAKMVSLDYYPYRVGVDTSTHKIYIADLSYTDGNIMVVDGNTLSVTDISVSGNTDNSEIAVNPNNHKAYVLGNGDPARVTALDGATNAVSYLALPSSESYPAMGLFLNMANNNIYVPLRDSSQVVKIDGSTNQQSTIKLQVTGTTVLTAWAGSAIVDSKANKVLISGLIYCATSTCGTTGSGFFAIDGPTDAVSVVPVNASIDVLNDFLALSPVSQTLYFIDSNGNVYPVNENTGTSGNTFLINAGYTFIDYHHATYSQLTNMIYIPNYKVNTVSAINGATNSATTLNTVSGPMLIAVDDTSNKVFVAPSVNVSNDIGITVISGPTATSVATATTLTSDTNPAQAGTKVTFTAYVAETSGTAIPTGNLTFSVDGTNVNTSALDSTGHATYATSSLASGSHSVVASYAGATGFGASTSSTLSESITAAAAASPAFSPAQGIYTSAQSVTISDTTTGATIYYTTDGSTPTTSSTKYTGAISVSSTETISAIAAASGYSNSAVSSATYTINPAAASTPTFSPAGGTYTSPQTVTISDTTTGASIYYTLDGSTPTTSSSKYSAPLTVNSTETISAIAAASGYSNSAVANATYTITLAAASTPTFSPAGGTYTSPQTVTISDTTTGASIYYTLDGSTPTTSSSKYSAPLTVNSTETISAIAAASGYSNSAVASAAYTITTATAPTPVLSSLTPGYTSAGSSAFTLTVTGSQFTSSSVVYWGTTALSTQYASATQLTAQVIATLAASAGTTNITVQTPSGGTSNSMQFEVDSATSGSSYAPTFSTSTAAVAAGAAASYTVSLPSTVKSATVSCLNLPTGASCSYSASSGTVTIATTTSTPKGIYQTTVVFTETVSGTTAAGLLLPFLILPLWFVRRRLAGKGRWVSAGLCLILLIAALSATGCGGGSSSSSSSAPAQTVTSSGTVTLTVQ